MIENNPRYERNGQGIALGIDTGGTYTDAVLVDHASGALLASAKALTTRHDLSIGIREAVRSVLAAPQRAEDVVLVGLSTTLATNAMVEGHGAPACLLLIGYDQELMNKYSFHRELGTDDYTYISGGHNELGDEVAALDEGAVREAVLSRLGKVEAFAVSGYFSVRNPAHELRAKALIEELTGLPVTCGYELSTRLNAVRRATTAALNARLIPLLRQLITTVRLTLDEQGVRAPLMVVKGDGSLVRSTWAMQRPIETILSGPAASVVGAQHLVPGGLCHAWVVDVGGTTTDIAALRDGLPRLNPEGARVGGWRTMVQAIDVHTTGLGGDSQVRWHEEGRLVVGPRRVVPLSQLAGQYPEIVPELRRQVEGMEQGAWSGEAEFYLRGRVPTGALSDSETDLLERLAAGPQPLQSLIQGGRRSILVASRLDSLLAQGFVQRSGFTPTDALHVLGRFKQWDTGAARLAAALLAAEASLPVDELCEQVVALVTRQVATELVAKALEDDTGQPVRWDRQPVAASLLARAFSPESSGPPELKCRLDLGRQLVAIGAPVTAYLPQVAALLNTELVIPPHAEVANAAGAVAGGVVQRVQVTISALAGDEEGVRLFLPDGCRDFAGPDEAAGYAMEVVPPYAGALATQAGADQVEVQVTRHDQWAQAGSAIPGAPKMYLGSELVFTATGRPATTREPDKT